MNAERARCLAGVVIRNGLTGAHQDIREELAAFLYAHADLEGRKEADSSLTADEIVAGVLRLQEHSDEIEARLNAATDPTLEGYVHVPTQRQPLGASGRRRPRGVAAHRLTE